MKEKIDSSICPAGHKCKIRRNTFKDLGGKEDSGEFECENCYEKGKYQDGAYVCA